jgi:hypothetical protein
MLSRLVKHYPWHGNVQVQAVLVHVRSQRQPTFNLFRRLGTHTGRVELQEPSGPPLNAVLSCSAIIHGSIDCPWWHRIGKPK